MRNRFNITEDEDNLMGDINDFLVTEVTDEIKAEVKAEIEKKEDAHILVPLDYQIFSTHNNEPTGKKEIVDTYKCDRNKGIVPSGKARIKADLMQKAFRNKTFFVEETSSKIFESGRATTVKKIYYQTK